MKKENFIKGFEEVMGVKMTWEDFFIGLLMVFGMLAVLQIGELL